MKPSKRYSSSATPKLRQNIIHTSDDKLTVLLGDVCLSQSQKSKFVLEYPKDMKKKPAVTIRFVEEDQLQTYIDNCDDGELAIPENFDSYPSPDLSIKTTTEEVPLTNDRPGRYIETWESVLKIRPKKSSGKVEVEQQIIEFKSDAKEGAYIFQVSTPVLVDGAADNFVVAVYNKKETSFPINEDDDLSELLNFTVNLSKKNGYIWFVNAIYFAEELLNVKLSDDIKEEMASCEGLDGMTGMLGDKETTDLQWGYTLDGIKKFRLDVDKDTEDCVETDNIQVTPESERFEFDTFKKGGL